MSVRAIDWKELETRGFVVVRSLLSEQEVADVRRVYETAKRNETIYVSMVAAPADVAPIAARLEALLPSIRSGTDIQTDTLNKDGYFFPTEYTNLGWHTDHKSYYALQDHYHYLNFWMPIIKPRADKSGLGLVPMDKLAAAAPDVYRAVVRRGAATVKDGTLSYEGDGRIEEIPCATELIDGIAEAPELLPGDVIVARTDVLHRTQDAETVRVALTMRGSWSRQVLRKRVLLVGSPEKHQRMLAESTGFKGILACFWIKGRNEITLADCGECLQSFVKREWRTLAIGAAASFLFPLVLLPYRVRSMRAKTGSYLKGVLELVRFDRRYRRASRAMREQPLR